MEECIAEKITFEPFLEERQARYLLLSQGDLGSV